MFFSCAYPKHDDEVLKPHSAHSLCFHNALWSDWSEMEGEIHVDKVLHQVTTTTTTINNNINTTTSFMFIVHGERMFATAFLLEILKNLILIGLQLIALL